MPACPMCACASVTKAWQYHSYTILKCPVCMLEFADQLSGGSVDYYQTVNANDAAAFQDNTRHPGFQYIVRALKQTVARHLTPDQRSVIDVGCGAGYLLAELQKFGFDVLGIDFDPVAVQVAKEYFHVHAQVGSVQDLKKLPARFDLALLTHVLEHVQNPRGLLQDIHDVVAPAGVLFIDVPNRNRFTIRRSLHKGELEAGEYPPHHLTFWSTQSLTWALRATGWTVLECRVRPFNQENQVELFLTRQLPKTPQLNHGLAKILGATGNLVGLAGETITAITRRS